MFLLKRVYFNKTLIIKGLVTAILFSSSLYLSYFDIEVKIINTILALLSLYLLLTIPRISVFYSGFFIGLFYFYWISFSFIFYDLFYLVPFIILGFAVIYGFFFLSISIFNNIYAKALSLFILSYVEPLSFNWLKFELLFVNSYFGISKLSLALVLLSLVLLIKKKNILFFLTILLAYFIQIPNTVKDNDIKIYLPQYSFKQDYKWNKNNLQEIINKNLEQIDYAIQHSYEVVVLPETTFPLLLNTKKELMDILYEKSNKITIITGALFYENKQYRNSTYMFTKGKLQVAHKVVLVPFGEAVPFPEIIKNLINNTFYNGAKDYVKAKNPSNFNIKGINFRNAICYEATTDEIYKDLKDVKYVIAISNNAWFTPSIEPTLQRLLMKYYARKYDLIIYHTANGSKNGVIRPY